MKIPVRYETLRKMVYQKWAQTNEFGSEGKSHFLQMRRVSEGNLVRCIEGVRIPWEESRVKDWGKYGRTHYGSNMHALYYIITHEGLIKLRELWPDDPDIIAYQKKLTIEELKRQT